MGEGGGAMGEGESTGGGEWARGGVGDAAIPLNGIFPVFVTTGM